MNAINSSRGTLGDGLARIWRTVVGGRGLNRGASWGIMIIGALVAFEIFNFSTTEFALRDVLGDLTFAGLPWATVLAVAFCGIDFAGIARIFTPQQGRDEPAEVWYLFGAWLLAAGFNAALTWWGVSVAIAENPHSASSAVIGSATVTRVVPVFVAVMVWLIRVLIIGTFSIAGDKLFSTADLGSRSQRSYAPAGARPQMGHSSLLRASTSSLSSFRPAPKPAVQASTDIAEPTYQNLGFDAAAREQRLQ